jgi:hypothetical protein
VCELTPEQVAAWYARPMAAMRRATGGAAPGGGSDGFRGFVRKFEALGVRKTPAEWEAAYRRHTGAQADG